MAGCTVWCTAGLNFGCSFVEHISSIFVVYSKSYRNCKLRKQHMPVSSERFQKDLLKWFDDNLIKSSPDKCHLLVSSCEKIKMVNRWLGIRK